jgi:hypothetical protein
MVQLQLNLSESSILRRILLSYLSGLRTDLAGREIEGFGDAVAEQRAVAEKILSGLDREGVPVSKSMFGEYSE